MTKVVWSFDIGTRHLSYAFVAKRAAEEKPILLHWTLHDTGTTKVWDATERLYTHLETMWQQWGARVTYVVLETQMAPKMKSLFHALHMYFLTKTTLPADCIVAFSSAHKLTVKDDLLNGEDALSETETALWRRVLKRKSAYGLRKDLSILHALRLVAAMPQAERWTRELLQWYDEDKADDVADALLQAIVFFERQQTKQGHEKTTTAKRIRKPGRLYPTTRRRHG